MTAARIAAILFAIIVAATAVLLVISQNVRDRLVVDQVEITNRLVVGERPVRIRFRLTEDEDRATLAVVDRRGDVVETLAEDEPLGDYEIHRFRWDGTSDLEKGTYRIRLTLGSLERRLLLPEEVDVEVADG